MTTDEQTYPSHPHLTRQASRLSPKELFGQILALLSENSKGILELKSSMSEIRLVKEEIEAWKPEVDHRVADQVKQLFSDRGKSTLTEEAAELLAQLTPASTKARAMKVSSSAHLEPSCSGQHLGQKVATVTKPISEVPDLGQFLPSWICLWSQV